ncbi:MAG: methyltransferase [Amylibacter sp.]|jgi:tRNA1(Val) A37 N6-methylase TrmN6|tara:strand:- start:18569 stop:19309 length:741 start_codon:yes stop_codon:yes gene_type:complete
METQDTFLNQRLIIRQPRNGYRAATDPVFMAASVPARAGQSILDIGCGVGVASLCLGARISGLSLTGIELQMEYTKLAKVNAANNNLYFEVINSDLANLPDALKQKSFDHIMTNPPFFIPETLSKPLDSGKLLANVETMKLGEWITLSLKRLKSHGSFTIIHLAERLPEILTHMGQSCGNIRILPISSRKEHPAKRIIIQAIKGSKSPMKLLPPFIVHDGDQHNKDGNDYSLFAEKILRHGAELDL